MKKLILFLTVTLFVASCVPARKFQEISAKAEASEKQRAEFEEQNKEYKSKLDAQQIEIDGIKSEISGLKRDTLVNGTSLRKMTNQYDKINSLNDELIDKVRQLQQNNANESTKLVIELENTKKILQEKEDDLRDMEKALNAKEKNLGELSGELKQREQRVKELESLIAQKEEASNALKKKISDALLGFKDKGLTVVQKNGNIYVSMDAKLLFSKGSTVVDQEGKKALQELANVLKDQTDISILVEGHTDTDKINGGLMKDNWDLSVLRSTSVVRILTENKGVDPKRVTPAGRGEYVPVDEGTTELSKSKNRRIEIVITPNLDELFELIDK